MSLWTATKTSWLQGQLNVCSQLGMTKHYYLTNKFGTPIRVGGFNVWLDKHGNQVAINVAIEPHTTTMAEFLSKKLVQEWIEDQEWIANDVI